MMLGGGEHSGERILSRPSVELMTADHLTPGQRQGAEMLLGDNSGWGFGMSVVTRRDDPAATPGRFGWDGGYGTSGYSDPREDMVGILMTQRLAGPDSPGIDLDFWTSAYGAIDD
jgi:CubicO group peptidase (beta-lactamase class C family)